MASATLPFDTTDCRRHFRRVIAEQARARQQRSRHARQARRPAPSQPTPVLEGDAPLSATDAMHWLHLGPTPFYYWRNTLDIHPIVKANHQALYARQDLLRLHAAYLAHASTEETPHANP